MVKETEDDIAGARAHIENPLVRVRVNGPDKLFSPKVVHAETKQMIAPVVLVCHRIKNEMCARVTHS